jgi:hypothetical protein
MQETPIDTGRTDDLFTEKEYEAIILALVRGKQAREEREITERDIEALLGWASATRLAGITLQLVLEGRFSLVMEANGKPRFFALTNRKPADGSMTPEEFHAGG